MTHQEQDTIVGRAYKEYRTAEQALAVLEASCKEIATTSSITTEEGYFMYSPSGSRLVSTNHVREQVALYRAAKRRKQALRQHLIDLGEPDPG
jgi:hypothetical protein